MKNFSVYIKIFEDKSYIHTSGIEFIDFINGMQLKNTNFLILKGFPQNCKYSRKLCLEYVTKKLADKFIKEDVYRYGDFCWLDYEDDKALSKITKDELAQMLYMGHKMEPFNNFRFTCLNNKYAYICHDDGWWNNVYMENTNNYKNVIAYILAKKLKGRKRNINLPDDILLDKIMNMCKEGAFIDFEKSDSEGVHIYTIGNIQTTDDLVDKIDRIRKRMGYSGEYIWYESRKKIWQYS